VGAGGRPALAPAPARAALALAGAAGMHLRLHGLRQHRLIHMVVQPTIMAVLAVNVLRAAGTGVSPLRALVGSGLVAMWAALVGSAAMTLRREREWYGTFQVLATTPAPLSLVFSGYLIGEAAMTVGSVVVGIGVGALTVGRLPIALSPAVGVALAVTTLSCAALALVVAPLMVILPVLTRWINVLSYPVWILAGLMFPITILPGWTSPLSYALAPYWAAQALDRSGETGGFDGLAPLWGAAAALAACYYAASLALFGLVSWRMRRTGFLLGE
jgi:ABC-2 type transport system permease protein